MQSFDGENVLFAGGPETEDAASHDRLVASRRNEVVQRRDPKPRVRCAKPTALNHVRRGVASIDIEAFTA